MGTVGCYHPNSSKPQRSTLKAKGHLPADIMRVIKSSKREFGRTTPLRASNPALTPMQEAEQNYTSLFTTATGSQPPSTTQIEMNSVDPKVQDPGHQTAVRPIEAHQSQRPQQHIVITNEEVGLSNERLSGRQGSRFRRPGQTRAHVPARKQSFHHPARTTVRMVHCMRAYNIAMEHIGHLPDPKARQRCRLYRQQTPSGIDRNLQTNMRKNSAAPYRRQ